MIPSTTTDQQQVLLLPGLDGTNPLGFLAALGVVRALDRSADCGPAKLHWPVRSGMRVAAVHLFKPSNCDSDHLVELLLSILNKDASEHPAKRWPVFIDGDPHAIRDLISAEPDAWSACIGVEPLSHTDPGKRISQLQTARKDYHIKAIDNLLKGITREQLQRSLLKPWDYHEPLEGLTLHIDPSEDRRHAYQWNQPAGDPDRKTHGNMVAANRLALEAFAFFPIIHAGAMSQTIGFQGHYRNDTFWTWPLWTHPADVQVIGSLLALPELQRDRPDPRKLHAMGIPVVLRSQRILVGKTPNFTPAQRIA